MYLNCFGAVKGSKENQDDAIDVSINVLHFYKKRETNTAKQKSADDIFQSV